GAHHTARVRGSTQCQPWLAINGKSDYHVYYNNKLVAFLWLVPLRDEIMEPFIQGKIHWRDIQPELARMYKEGLEEWKKEQEKHALAKKRNKNKILSPQA
ncbi:MAG TPA: hypothetical protein VEU97_06945, partial [Ktedonobacteraceae bacterium]|nr:hypothetical protein [Ktedonobacteraceae bacterium]